MTSETVEVRDVLKNVQIETLVAVQLRPAIEHAVAMLRDLRHTRAKGDGVGGGGISENGGSTPFSHRVDNGKHRGLFSPGVDS
jgi:hypothetical protein